MSEHRDDGPDDESLRFLLARGRLSGAERERILERALQGAGAGAAPGARSRPRRWLALLAMAVVPAAAVMIAVVRRPGGDGGEPGGARAKGPAAGAVLQARCPEREPGRCRRGDRLVFEIDGAPEGGLLAAYAEGAGGQRIWYFPTADGRLATVPPAAGHALAGEGVRLGDEHAPGRYTLHLFVLDRPADRAALLDGSARPRAAAAIALEVLP